MLSVAYMNLKTLRLKIRRNAKRKVRRNVKKLGNMRL